MPIASLSAIEKTYGRRQLFVGVDLLIDRGERIGLIGDNGSGKSTLMKLFTQEVIPEAGIVAISKGIRVGYLAQDPVLDFEKTVVDEAEEAFADLHALSHRLRDLEHEMSVKHDEELQKVLDKYQEVQHEFELAGGYAWRHKLEATLLGVGLGREVWEQMVGTLSGGQRSRLALAQLLIAQPDILLLDEPTNHLDLAAIEWLEEYLKAFDGAVLIISHDRYLLDRLSTRIIWLSNARIRSYPGNYTNFTEQRALQELSQQRAYEQQQADIDKQKEFVRRFGAGQRSREAKGREKRLNRLLKSDAIIEKVEESNHIHLSINSDMRAGDQVLRVRELSKAYDDKKLWKDLKFDIRRGERIGILGPNGSGKTTLLEVLLARRDADAGEVKWGASLNVGYYDQQLGDLDPTATIYDELCDGRSLTDQQIRDTLAAMLFRKEDVEKTIDMLSGGERARVRLAQLLVDEPNVLLLDEPTNHLDIASCEALERTLRNYPGTLLFVSHDRYFINRVAQRLLILDPPGMIDFSGTYSDWQRKQAEMAAEAASEKAAQKKVNKGSSNQSRPAAPAASKNKYAGKSQADKAQTDNSRADKTGVNSAHSGGSAKRPAVKKDNPYSRPFGRLTIKELESQITQTEIDVQDCQVRLADAANFRNPKRGREIQAENDILARKLKQLEEEYYLREQ